MAYEQTCSKDKTRLDDTHEFALVHFGVDDLVDDYHSTTAMLPEW